jgi:hypothetical protein
MLVLFVIAHVAGLALRFFLHIPSIPLVTTFERLFHYSIFFTDPS